MKTKFTLKKALYAFAIPAFLAMGHHVKAQAPATCTPTYSQGCTAQDDIKDYTLVGASTTLSNLNTTCGASYIDFTSSTTLGVPDLIPGSTYSGIISTNYTSSEYVRIWIDYDDNGVFDPTTELATNFGPFGSGAQVPYSFTVPATVTPGYKRMRVMLVFANGTFLPCSSNTYGECNDYKVLVLSTTPCVNPPVAGTSTMSPTGQSCPGFPINLGLSGVVFGSNQTYEWESSPNNTTYTSLGPASLGPGMTVAPLVTTWYRCKIVCNGGTPAYSTPVQVTVAPGLAGTYTVNNASPTAGTNFNNFTDLATALNCGIVAPVTINVVSGSGPYTEAFTVNNIGGSSATNTVRINGNGTTLQYNGTTIAGNKTVTLNNTKYLRIDNLKIKGLNATYAWGVFITGTAQYDSITNCEIDVSALTTTSTVNGVGINISGSATSPTTGTLASNIYIGNNLVKAGGTGGGGAYYGINSYGPSAASFNEGIIIENNEVVNFYLYGIQVYNSRNGSVKGNNVHRSTKTVIAGTTYAINTYYVESFSVVKNKVHDMGASTATTTGGFYGIRSYSPTATATTGVLIANNALYNLKNHYGSQYHMYIYGPYNKVYHNSIDVSAVQTANTGALIGIYATFNDNSEFKNNNVVITGGNTGIKYGMYFGSTTYSATLAKNNFYVNSTQAGNNVPYYWGSAYTSLAAFQAAFPGQEVGSPNVNPLILAPTTGNLTPTNSAVISQGANVYTSVNDDINGLPRTPVPTLGAFEYVPTVNNDATALVFTSPTSYYCPNTNSPVEVVIGNAGLNNINNMKINWSINGVLQPQISYTGTLIPPGSTGSGQMMDTVLLGNTILPIGASTIKVWTSLPNNVADVNNVNDTIVWSAYSALLGGTYTINSGAPASLTNFQSFGALSTALSYGICGPIVVNVVSGSGPYTETVSFGNITGASNINTIRINGNGEVLQYNATSSNYVLVGLNGTRHMTINNLKIKSLNNTYGWGVLITGNAYKDSIINCAIDLGNIIGTSSVNAVGIAVSGSNSSPTATSTASNIYIGNNTLNCGTSTGVGGAYYGIAVSGFSSTNFNDSINIVNNEIFNFYYYGLNYNYCKNSIVSGNNIHRSGKTAITTAAYGINVNYCNNLSVVKNRIHDLAAPGVSVNGTFYGLRVYNFNTTALTPVLIANNALYNLGALTGTQYITYICGAGSQVYHNSIDASAIQPSGTGSMFGMYLVSPFNGSEIQNNNFNISGGNNGPKYGIYLSTTSNTANLQKNNFYVNSTQTGANNPYYWGAAFTSLAAFQTAFPTQEIGSPNAAPNFLSPTMGDLSPLNTALMTAGNNQLASVPTDINGMARSTTPTLGAFEFSVSGINNARALTITNPFGHYCATTVPVHVMIGNVGNNNITSLQVNWSVNGVLQTPISYNDTLVPIGSTTGQSFDTVVVGNALLNPGNNIIKSWTSLPNGVADTYPLNDTTTLNAVPATFALSPSVSPICANETSIVSLNPGYGYADGALEWEQSIDGGLTWTVITNTDTVKYISTNIGANTTYRVHILTGGTNCYSPNATVNVNYVAPPTVVGDESCYPDSLTISATPSTGNNLKWYEFINSGSVYSTNSTITTPFLNNTKIYYAVSETSSGCQSVRTPVAAVIHVLPPVNLGYDNTICIDSGAVYYLYPGVQHPGATYFWDNSTTDSTRGITQSGTYYVTVTDTNTCFNSDTITMVLNQNPVVDLEAGGVNFCIGSTKVLDAGPDGQNGGSYYWNTGEITQTITVTTGGQYTVEVSSPDGCTTYDTIDVINSGYAPTLEGIHTSAIGSSTFQFEAINPQNVTDYFWEFGDGTTSTQMTPQHQYTANGIYLVKLTVNSTCADEADSAYVNIIGLGLNGALADTKVIQVYPNPNRSGQLTLETVGNIEVKSIKMVNIIGQQQMEWNKLTNNKGKYQLDIPANITDGMYQLIIETDKGTAVRKLEILR